MLRLSVEPMLAQARDRLPAPGALPGGLVFHRLEQGRPLLRGRADHPRPRPAGPQCTGCWRSWARSPAFVVNHRPDVIGTNRLACTLITDFDEV
ncbi:hypothetical protein ABZX90_10670 [Streptomyces sp. NPDC002935]|uniref:hypothetical protein n=1 Tax=Streptomyces sp. NPDC002935 TaxID=3154545 RepID=UPI0033BB9F04